MNNFSTAKQKQLSQMSFSPCLLTCHALIISAATNIAEVMPSTAQALRMSLRNSFCVRRRHQGSLRCHCKWSSPMYMFNIALTITCTVNHNCCFKAGRSCNICSRCPIHVYSRIRQMVLTPELEKIVDSSPV